MRLSAVVAFLSAAVVATAFEFPPGVPRSPSEFREKHPYRPLENRSRQTITIRASANDTDDVSAEFLQGIKAANNGGTLYLPQGETFIIGKRLDLTFLNDVHVRLDGEIKFTNDTAYWQANAFPLAVQNSIAFWVWGGKDVKIYGNGVLNGNGQLWWNEFAGAEILSTTNAYLRPILFYAANMTNLDIQGIHLKDSPVWNQVFINATGISLRDIVCTAVSNNATSLPKNTDFFDSQNVQDVVVERAWVNNGDDCFSPKDNSSNIYVNTMYCNGSHGTSMGSLGQNAGVYSFIQDVHIENVWLLNGEHGARLKTWAGPNIGYGFIDNVTFKNFWQANNDYTAYLDSCYFNINQTMCAQYPSQVNISNVLFENFSGYSSGQNGRVVAALTCSSNPNAVCENIKFKNFNIFSPCGGEPVVICDNVRGDIGIPCVQSNSTEAKAAKADNCTVPLAELPTPEPESTPTPTPAPAPVSWSPWSPWSPWSTWSA